MKHWSLIVFRMMVRVGLVAAIVTWVCTQSVKFDYGVRIGPVAIAGGADQSGWMAVCLLDPANRTWWFNSRSAAEPEAETRRLNEWWPVIFDTRSGVKYRQLSFAWGHMLHFNYPFVCAAFLLATVATRKRKNPDSPPAEPAAASES